ncbi:MAG: hypothetical protein AAFW68_09445, partial [Pseudomonadota bacterium]
QALELQRDIDQMGDILVGVPLRPEVLLTVQRLGEGDRIVSTINVVGLRMEAFLAIPEAPAEYGAETTEARIERRFAKWTPTTFTNAALAASYFGPH